MYGDKGALGPRAQDLGALGFTAYKVYRVHGLRFRGLGV